MERCAIVQRKPMGGPQIPGSRKCWPKSLRNYCLLLTFRVCSLPIRLDLLRRSTFPSGFAQLPGELRCCQNTVVLFFPCCFIVLCGSERMHRLLLTGGWRGSPGHCSFSPQEPQPERLRLCRKNLAGQPGTRRYSRH